MQPLDTYDLITNAMVVVIMPFIIWANFRKSGLQSPVHDYLWRENANLMRVSLLILCMLTLLSAIALLANYGFISADMAETLAIVVGMPFMIAAVAMIVLAVVAAWRLVRGSRTGSKAA